MKYIFLRCVTVLALAILTAGALRSNTDSVNIRVHFLHGSKPRFKYRYTEDRWFGGVLGGHAGIEYETNRIINFQPKSRFHIFSKQRLINSKFSIHDTISFYEILGGTYDSAKKTIITLRISAQQKLKLDSVVTAYRKKCPYDYAFFGMRCGAAAYDVLANSGIVYKYSFTKTWRKIFYPRRLRRRLEGYATEKGFSVRKERGTVRRVWEAD